VGEWSPSRRLAGSVVWGLAVVVGGCALARRGDDLAEPTPIGGGTALEPSARGADRYLAPSPRPPPETDPLRKAVAEAIAQAATALRLPPPVRDARLDRAADDIARGTPGDQQPSFDLVAFLLAHYGVVEPEPNLVLVRGGLQANESIVDHLRPQLPAILRQGPHDRLGIGILREREQMVVVLALQDQHLELRPIPRSVAAGQVVHLSGRLRDGFRAPQVIVTPPVGPVGELRVRQWRGGFEARLECRAGQPGPYQVEIAATNEKGPGVLANFPIYCAVRPPDRSPLLVPERGTPQHPDDAAGELFRLINRDRQAVGLSPVRADRRLAEIARQHSREMAETGVVAHTSPRTGNAADRVRKTGLRPEIVAENVGRAYNAPQAQRGFMSSPGHRSNVLEPRLTHVGIGVVAGKNEGDAVPLFFTQLFAAGL
jgi:uncharacterized protein YkwD